MRLERTLGTERICRTADGSSELKNRGIERRVRASRTGESMQVETELPPPALIMSRYSARHARRRSMKRNYSSPMTKTKDRLR
jgi:hypothetical protein